MSISEIGAEIELKFMVIKGKRKGDGKQEHLANDTRQRFRKASIQGYLPAVRGDPPYSGT